MTGCDVGCLLGNTFEEEFMTLTWDNTNERRLKRGCANAAFMTMT